MKRCDFPGQYGLKLYSHSDVIIKELCCRTICAAGAMILHSNSSSFFSWFWTDVNDSRKLYVMRRVLPAAQQHKGPIWEGLQQTETPDGLVRSSHALTGDIEGFLWSEHCLAIALISYEPQWPSFTVFSCKIPDAAVHLAEQLLNVSCWVLQTI